jgi:hypothetical protein
MAHSLVAVAEAGRLRSGQGILTARTSGNMVQHNRIQEDSVTTSMGFLAKNSQTIQPQSITKSLLSAVKANGSRMTPVV